MAFQKKMAAKVSWLKGTKKRVSVYVFLVSVSVFLEHISVSRVSEDLGKSLNTPLKPNGWKLKNGSPSR